MVSVARVLVGVTGGIAAYKACDLIRLFVKRGHEVVPLVTHSAEDFVRAQTFFALARRSPSDDPYPHLERADLLVIAPATANTIAKLAHGLSDNLVTEAALAHQGPVAVAPAMSPRMWAHPATQANVDVLRARGVELVGPEEGDTGEGEWGVGRMSEPEAIFARCLGLLGETDTLRGKRVLVTAGGTREPLDAVRFLGNRSSGRMGVALAEEARRRGAEVTLLAANLAVPAPSGIEVVGTPTAKAMLEAALERKDADVVLMAAAVADYRPREQLEDKRAKDDSAWQLTLDPTTDILRELGTRRDNGQVLVGFAADRGSRGLARAREKLVAKGIDLVVFNDVSRDDIGFDAPHNEVVLVGKQGEQRIGKAPKDRIASAVVDKAEELLRERA
jgi:phosphopantothenoylcysteine decarboxylase / phosphopantothenate---cysteine ligase